MTIREMKNQLKRVLSPARFQHSEGVMKEACRLAEFYHVNVQKAQIAGILHDCAKNIDESEAVQLLERSGVLLDHIQKRMPTLWHGILGAILAKEEYGVTDDEILDAIYWHTTGKAGMTPLEKIIFIADYIEEGRSFEGVEEARKLAYQDMNHCILFCSDATIRNVLQKGWLLHPNTIDTRNEAVIGMEKAVKEYL